MCREILTQQLVERTLKFFSLTRPENRRENLFKSTQSVIYVVQNILVQSETKLLGSISDPLAKAMQCLHASCLIIR